MNCRRQVNNSKLKNKISEAVQNKKRGYYRK
jgi:hypothetical protein